MKHAAILLIVYVSLVGANPAFSPYFSELAFDQFGWQLELLADHSLEGWYLMSHADTAYFEPGLSYDWYMVITNNDLEGSLAIDAAGDTLSLYAPDLPTYPIDRLAFGDVEGAQIAAPPAGGSISFILYESVPYLDLSPTLGAENDTTGGMGDIQGTITDQHGTPVEDARVVYGYEDTGQERFVLTDELGRFHIHDYARLEYFLISRDGCITQSDHCQIWPDSTVTVAVTLECQQVAEESDGVHPGYRLRTGTPNPASDTVTFAYELPRPEFVRIAIYDLGGALVNVLHAGHQVAGVHQVRWRTGGAPAGTHFCTLKTPQATITEPIILTR